VGHVKVRRVLVPVLALAVGLAGCGDDDSSEGGPAGAGDVPHAPTTEPPETGGIEVPEIPGTFAAALPADGFGIAVPEGWQATRLDEEALERLEGAALARPAFLDAARQAAEAGAIFYAAGVDDQGRVSELKVDVQDGADTSAEAMRELAGSIVESGQLTDAVVVEDDPDDGRVRVDYRLALPSAEDGTPIDALGSQLFVADGDRLWSFIITSEDPETQTELLQIFDESITFDG
jgi:hypothetical protein